MKLPRIESLGVTEVAASQVLQVRGGPVYPASANIQLAVSMMFNAQNVSQ